MTIIDNTLTTNEAIHGTQHRVIVMAGRIWVFYYDGTNLCYKSSADSFTTKTSLGAVGGGYAFDVYYNGTYIYYARQQSSTLMYFRRGTPTSGGTISWSAVEQQVTEIVSGDIGSSSYLFVLTNTDGFPYILQANYNAFGWYQAKVYKSSTSSGTWVGDTAHGYPATFNGLNSNRPRVFLPMPANRLFAICACTYIDNNTYYYCQMNTGGYDEEGHEVWSPYYPSSEVANISSPYDLGSITTYGHVSGIAIDNDIYIAYLNNSGDIVCRKRTYGVGWANYGTILESAGSSVPWLSRVGSTLYCFWISAGGNVYYSSKPAGGAWSAPTVYATDLFSSLTITGSASYLGGIFAHVANLISPYSLKIGSGTSTPTVLTLEAGILDATHATLRGYLTEDGAQTTQCYFEYGTDTSYGSETTPGTVYEGNIFESNISGLSLGITYHYRAVAVNDSGVSYGDDESFTTGAPVLPSDGGVRVSSIRHIYKPGVYKMEVGIGGLLNIPEIDIAGLQKEGVVQKKFSQAEFDKAVTAELERTAELDRQYALAHPKTQQPDGPRVQRSQELEEVLRKASSNYEGTVPGLPMLRTATAVPAMVELTEKNLEQEGFKQIWNWIGNLFRGKK